MDVSENVQYNYICAESYYCAENKVPLEKKKDIPNDLANRFPISIHPPDYSQLNLVCSSSFPPRDVSELEDFSHDSYL